MKVLMLGWEYPPHISGGLGTACQGLTTSLAKLGVEIDFVVPHLMGNEDAPHMHLIDAYSPGQAPSAVNPHPPSIQVATEVTTTTRQIIERTLSIKKQTSAATITPENIPHENIQIENIPAFLAPYYTPETFSQLAALYRNHRLALDHLKKSATGSEEINSESFTESFFLNTKRLLQTLVPDNILSLMQQAGGQNGSTTQYGSDLFTEVGRFTKSVLSWAHKRQFDLIHAHDWMTYPAGIALSKLTGAPLVIHVHSLEYDRSGSHVNERIDQIERSATAAAQGIIAVSYYTRTVIHEQHGIPLDKISVAHNGVYSKEVISSYRQEKDYRSKIVLFLGRITFQKGPDYFVEAAARVVPTFPDVTFVMAGSGDMLPELVNRVLERGLAKNFVFTGFLKGEEVERMYSIADLYIMPSVSEPFGISTLEAVSHDVPVIISRQSGVSEVLSNALKVDFWDVERLSSLIIGVLKYPEIREDIVGMAREEIRRLHWDAAATKVADVYGKIFRNFLHSEPPSATI